MADDSSKGAGCGLLLVGLGAILALSLVPALVGPLLAPRYVTMGAGWICPDDAVSADVYTWTSSSGRGKSSSHWALRCAGADGVPVRADELKSDALSWVMFNVPLAALLFVSLGVFGAMDARLLRGRR